jgi:hypothetical protein
LDGVNKERRGRVIVLRGTINAEVSCSGCLELAMLMSEEKARQRTVQGKPYEGKPHVRFDEGTVET